MDEDGIVGVRSSSCKVSNEMRGWFCAFQKSRCTRTSPARSWHIREHARVDKSTRFRPASPRHPATFEPLMDQPAPLLAAAFRPGARPVSLRTGFACVLLALVVNVHAQRPAHYE